MECSEVRCFDSAPVVLQGQSGSVRCSSGKRAVFRRRGNQPLLQIPHTFFSFRKPVHGDIPRRFPTLETGLAKSIRVCGTTKHSRIALAYATARFIRRVQPMKEVVDPGGGGFGDERQALALLSFGFQYICHGEAFASSEVTTQLLLTRTNR